MRQLLNVILVLAATLTFATNAFSFSWFFGTDKTVDYVASYEDTSRILLPFTVEVEANEEWAGANVSTGTFLKDGIRGSGVWEEETWGIDINFNWYVNNAISGPAYILDSIAITDGFATDSVANGIYTAFIADISDGGIALGVWTDNHSAYPWISPLNNIQITVGDPGPAPVPEPSTILLLGGGLLGLGWYGRKRKKA